MIPFNQFLLATSPFAVYILLTDFLLNRYVKSIDVDKINKEAVIETKEEKSIPPFFFKNKALAASDENTEADEDIRYIVTGGSGFIGAWIARFLIFRGATKFSNVTVSVLDIARPPPDLEKHGVTFEKVDLLDKKHLEEAIDKIVLGENHTLLSKTKKTRVVVFNCAIIQRHYLPERGYGKNVAGLNMKMAQNLIDAVEHLANAMDEDSANLLDQSSISLINISDAQADYESPNWWNIFKYNTWKNTFRGSETDTKNRKYMSMYARSCAEIEQLILSKNNFKHRTINEKSAVTRVYTTSLKVQGITTGYYIDSVLYPGLKYGAIIDHAWPIPTCFIHVEDVCRAALLAENAIAKAESPTDQGTQGPSMESISNHSFLVSNGQMVYFGDTFLSKLTLATNNQFRDIRVFPVLVLMISFICQIITALFGGSQKGAQKMWRRRDSSIFSGYWWTLTRQRFNTIQTVQVPDAAKIRKTKRVIGFQAEVSAEKAIDDLVNDYVKYKK